MKEFKDMLKNIEIKAKLEGLLDAINLTPEQEEKIEAGAITNPKQYKKKQEEFLESDFFKEAKKMVIEIGLPKEVIEKATENMKNNSIEDFRAARKKVDEIRGKNKTNIDEDASTKKYTAKCFCGNCDEEPKPISESKVKRVKAVLAHMLELEIEGKQEIDGLDEALTELQKNIAVCKKIIDSIVEVEAPKEEK